MPTLNKAYLLLLSWVRAPVGLDKGPGISLVFTVSLLSTQHRGVRAKTGWFGTGIMCPSRATYLLAQYCFSEPAL